MAFTDEYETIIELGSGGYAQVFKARHKEFGYVRAIRVLDKRITQGDENYEKFIKEAQLLLRLGTGGHPNIVRIYQPRLMGTDALWEMDYIEGKTAEDFIKENKYFISIDEVTRCLLNISSALAYCHVDNHGLSWCADEDREYLDTNPDDGSIIISDENRKKLIKKYCVVHNDIKSNNIMRKYDGSYILLDFGLAFNTEGQTFSRSSLMNNGGIEYKAPEKWSRDKDEMTERTDIYSFGIVLYEMLAGRVPFPYDDSNSSPEKANYEISEHHQNTIPPAIEPLRKAAYEAANPGKTYEKDYPDWLEQVILKCLEKDPQKRYANAKELYEEVEPQINPNTKVKELEDQIDQLKQKLATPAKEKEKSTESAYLKDLTKDMFKDWGREEKEKMNAIYEETEKIVARMGPGVMEYIRRAKEKDLATLAREKEETDQKAERNDKATEQTHRKTIKFKTEKTWKVGGQEWSDIVVIGNKEHFTFDEVLGINKQLTEGWRVPTKQDFIDLDIALGGNGEKREDTPAFVTENYINRWGGAFGGYRIPWRSTPEPDTQQGRYWSQSKSGADNDGLSLFFNTAGKVDPYWNLYYNFGQMLRCVR